MKQNHSSFLHIRSIVEILQREHSEGAKHADELAQAAQSLQKNGFTVAVFEQIARSIRWINSSVRRHMQTEEQYIFPFVENENRELVGHLLAQHRELGAAFTQLMDTVSDVEEGSLRGSILQELAMATNTVVELLEDHMAEENASLYPLVMATLDIKA